jgi:hypothetical protein
MFGRSENSERGNQSIFRRVAVWKVLAGWNQSPLFDTRISYLKILALSLLREIDSAENTSEVHGNDTIDLHAEVRRFETELIRSALIHTGRAPTTGSAFAPHQSHHPQHEDQAL